MPEGDTVHLTARRLDKALAGRRITRSDFRVPRYATLRLDGDQIAGVTARGKHLLIRTAGGKTIHSHLKMEGRWDVYKPGERWRGPAHEVRLALVTEGAVAVAFRVTMIEVVRTADEERLVGHLGPDPLGDWDAAEAVRRGAGRSGTISDLLLDQTVVAGFGNVYRNEICFLRGVNPWTPSAETDVAAAIDLGARLLRLNKDTARHVTTGVDRPGRRHWVYGRDRRGCFRCNTPILRRDEPGERVTYWCPHCQPTVREPAGESHP